MSAASRHRHGYLLDLDGTLVDTHDSNVAAYEQAIRETCPGIPFSHDKLLRLITEGESYTKFIPAILPDVSIADMQAIATRKAIHYPNHLDLSTLNTCLVERARSWREERGSVVVLVTTAKRTNALRVLQHHHIVSLFDHAVFGDDVTRPKPSPDIYLRALSQVNLYPEEAEAYEDSQTGIMAARAAGLRVTKVIWGQRHARHSDTTEEAPLLMDTDVMLS